MTERQPHDPQTALLQDALAGRVSRREVMTRAVALGLSTPAIAALLAACGGGSDEPSSGDNGAAPTTATGDSDSSTSSGGSSTETTDSGGDTPAAGSDVIVQAMGLDIDELDPHYFKSIPGYYAVANLYEMLMDYQLEEQEDGGLYPAQDANGDWIFVPWLAESFEVSDDQTTLTFKIRDDATFSDGTPVTAQDVKASWDRGVSGDGYANVVMGVMGLTSPDQIVLVDESTIQIQLDKPNPFALKMVPINVLSIMSEKSIQENATSSDESAHEFFHKNAFGSGPYILKNWTPGERWELAPNPNYWNPDQVKNSGTIVKTIPSASERYNLLVRGDIDVAYDLQPKDLAALRDNPDIKLHQFNVPWPYYLGMNNTMAPFDNVKVRQAVCYSIPYKTIIENVLHGFGQECKSPVAKGQPTSDFSFWNYDTDPEKTKQLLDEAGVSNLEFDLNILQGRPQDEQIAVWIQSGLAQAGVQVNINKMTDAEWYDKFSNRQHPSFIGEWYSWVNDPFFQMFWNFHGDAPTNSTGYNNPEVNRLIDEGMYETDAAKREQMSKQAQKIIVEEAPWAILYQLNYTIAVRKNIEGFNWYPDVGTRFWKIAKV